MNTGPKYSSSEKPSNGNNPVSTGLSEGYTISGKVVHGNHLGRTLGFPTANIHPPDDDYPSIPNGVYLVSVLLKGKKFFGLCNIGKRPTIGGTRVVIEVNILDFSEDLYGAEISITVIQALRKEKKFKNLTQLVSQMNRDKSKVMKILSAPDKDNAG
ncbi:MAG: riboflavin kinase [Bacteroidota bacterium]|jgi:riboflavin kinase / FMN adenylyltransferase